VPRKRGRPAKIVRDEPVAPVEEENYISHDENSHGSSSRTTEVSKNGIRKRGRPAKIVRDQPVENYSEINSHDENSHGSSSRTTDVSKNEARKRGRPRKVEFVQQQPETEEDSVYYDIPGEGSSDGVKEISDSESEVEQPDEQEEIVDSSEDEPIIKKINKKNRKLISASEENSNHGSTVSSNASKRRRRSRYEHDDDFEVYTDEASNISDASHVTKSSGVSMKPRRGAASHDSGIVTRKKVNSRSTSRSAAVSEEISEHSEQSEVEESDFEMESDNEESDEEQAIEYAESDGDEQSEEEQSRVSDASDEFDDDSDSIDIKYSPIKTRHARRRIGYMNVKQMRGKCFINFIFT
jgi:hypothetical protein